MMTLQQQQLLLLLQLLPKLPVDVDEQVCKAPAVACTSAVRQRWLYFMSGSLLAGRTAPHGR